MLKASAPRDITEGLSLRMIAHFLKGGAGKRIKRLTLLTGPLPAERPLRRDEFLCDRPADSSKLFQTHPRLALPGRRFPHEPEP